MQTDLDVCSPAARRLLTRVVLHFVGVSVRSSGSGLSHPERTTVLLAVILLAAAQSGSAQVGLASGTQQVALVARVPARAALQEVISLRDKVSGSIRETSVRVRLAANTGYSLIVRHAQTSGSRLWVRTDDGRFHELVAGTPITVARNAPGNEECEQEVQYRLESEDARVTQAPLPVRYEVVVDPAL